MNPHLHSTNELRPDRWNSSHFIWNDVNLETSLNLTVAVRVLSLHKYRTHRHTHTYIHRLTTDLFSLQLWAWVGIFSNVRLFILNNYPNYIFWLSTTVFYLHHFRLIRYIALMYYILYYPRFLYESSSLSAPESQIVCIHVCNVLRVDTQFQLASAEKIKHSLCSWPEETRHWNHPQWKGVLPPQLLLLNIIATVPVQSSVLDMPV